MEPNRTSLDDARRLLGNCVLFRGLDIDERSAIIGHARIRNFPAGEKIFSIGAPSDYMAAVLTGHVLKDPGILLRYHMETEPPPPRANRPVEIEPRLSAVEQVLREDR